MVENCAWRLHQASVPQKGEISARAEDIVEFQIKIVFTAALHNPPFLRLVNRRLGHKTRKVPSEISA